MRLQTLYRTLVGMMRHRTAMRLLLRSELPMLSSTELDAIVDAKCALALAEPTLPRVDPSAPPAPSLNVF